MGFYDSIDLRYDDNGDIMVSEQGDLDITDDDFLTGWIQQIHSLVKASTGDWESIPAYAADLNDFVGKPNTRDVGQDIEARIRGALIMNYVANAGDIYVRAVPVRPDVILIILVLNVTATVDNRLREPGDTSMAFMLNLPSGELVTVNPDKVVNYFPRRG